MYGHDLGRRAGSTAPQSNKQADLQLASGCLVCRQLTQEGKGNKEAKKKQGAKEDQGSSVGCAILKLGCLAEAASLGIQVL